MKQWIREWLEAVSQKEFKDYKDFEVSQKLADVLDAACSYVDAKIAAHEVAYHNQGVDAEEVFNDLEI